jgi:phage terminase large subunit-like protein
MDTFRADTHAYISYGDSLSLDFSRKVRATVTEKTNIKITTSAAEQWETADGGGLVATSVGGALTGKRISGVMIIDDPYRNRQDAESPAWKRKVNDWFREVALTRLQKSASVIVIHTRWSEDDLIGNLLLDGGFSYRNIPAITESGHSQWPEQYPLSLLEERKREIGDWSFEALYQGNPRPKGDSVFREPVYHSDSALDGWTAYIAADPAASTSTKADYSVAVAIATKGTRYYGAKIGIESVGGFKAVPQMLREIDPNLRVVEIRPLGDKFQRAQPVASAWNGGRVTVPSNASWVGPFVKELTSFTGVGDSHDDQVDALSYAWQLAVDAMATSAERLVVGSGRQR